MYCPKCGTDMGENSRYCPGCGSKKKKMSVVKMLMILCTLSILIFGGTIVYMFFQSEREQQAQPVVSPTKVNNADENDEKVIKEVVALPKNLSAAEKKSVTEMIAETQQKVYTIYTDNSQGSGFLINNKGDVVTNAHVVEGAVSLSVKDRNGKNHKGTIIGYSNSIDVAVIRVPDLAKQTPLKIEKSKKAKIGEEVIAFGSPLDLENTATFGYITGVDRNFYIGSRSYDNIYQTSAAIAPGSSGGPLVSKQTGKVIAINSAKMNGQDAIGFSIPLSSVNDLILKWIKNPLSEDEIYALFYNENGEFYYQEFWDDDAYFDGGEYSEDEQYDMPIEEYEEDYSDESTDESYIDEDYEEYNDYDDSEMIEEGEPVTEEPVIEDPPNSDQLVTDINGDGVIDVNDLTTDLNGDGVLDELDLNYADIPGY